MNLAPDSIAIQLGVPIVVGLLTYWASTRKNKNDLRIALAQIESQTEIAREQFKAQLEIERERQRRARLEEAYAELMTWSYRLSRAMDSVWSGICCPDDLEKVTTARQILNDWPRKWLIEPESAARFSHYWSGKARWIINEFSGASAEYWGHAGIAMRDEPGQRIADDKDAKERMTLTWQSRSKLDGILGRLREQVRQELTA